MAETQAQTRELLARLARAERELATLRADLARRGRPRRRGGRAATLAVALLVALVPLGLLAANPFDDLNANSVHNDSIEAIYGAGITTGCLPNKSYCPNVNVTREEMASFLARTAGLGTNKPVARAAKLAAAPAAGSGPAYAANELTRLAFVNSTDPAGVPVATAGKTPIVEVALNVPVQSYVRVSFTALASATSAVECPCTLRAYLQQDDQPEVVVKRINLVTAATDIVNGFERRDLSGSTVFLAAPGDHRYRLVVEQVFSDNTTLAVTYPNLQAELFPFGGGGAGASGIDAPAAPGAPRD